MIISGPADERAVREMRGAMDSVESIFLDQVSLSCLPALLSRSKVFLGNDSGITHLAAACDVPTVALFGPTDPGIWGPRGRRVKIVRGDDSCPPCDHGTGTSCTMPNCMRTISGKDVICAIESMIQWD